MANREYAELLKDPRWQKKRLLILDRDRWECSYCGEKTKTLHVHHRAYQWGKKPWEYDDAILVTLCVDCHQKQTDLKKMTDAALASVDEGSERMRVLGYIQAQRAIPECEEIHIFDWEQAQGVADAFGWGISGDDVCQRVNEKGFFNPSAIEIDWANGWRPTRK